jgi:phosphoglycolate phosphatase
LTRIATPVGGFRLVIFDYDGTLFDTRPAIVHCIGRAFEEYGRSNPAHDAVAGIVGTGATLLDTLLLLDPGLRRDRTALNDLVITYRNLYRDESTALLRAFPGVPAILQHLRLNGIRCAVVSNKGVDAVRRSFDETGLGSLIDVVVGEQPGTPKKPDPRVVTDLIAPRFDLRRDEMLMVGDTEIDILFAKRAGIASCWVSYGYGAPAHCRAGEPDYEISSISHLREIVAKSDSRRASHVPL